jgi:glycosyltransferase involved in cell wall biosynthesis
MHAPQALARCELNLATPNISILIATCNRAQSLRSTLESIHRVNIPRDLAAEVIVVENGSTDGTAQVVKSFASGGLPVRYLREPKAGKSNSLNRAIAEALGDIFLFTDDDVRVPQNWIDEMCRPIASGEADAVQGGVELAPHLLRHWMDHCHHAHLASTAFWHPERGDRIVLIGANMAIARRVFERVPAFDTEIGPGPAAGGEDTLFSFQAELAGFKFAARPKVSVEHHPDMRRLGRRQMLRQEWLGGLSSGYLIHHWEHQTIRWPHLRLIRAALKLMLLRLRRSGQWSQPEGAPAWELLAYNDFSTWYHYLGQRKRPRAYAKHGLVKSS